MAGQAPICYFLYRVILAAGVGRVFQSGSMERSLDENAASQKGTRDDESPQGVKRSASLEPQSGELEPQAAAHLLEGAASTPAGTATTAGKSESPLAGGSISSGQILPPVVKPGPAVSTSPSANGNNLSGANGNDSTRHATNGISSSSAGSAPSAVPASTVSPNSSTRVVAQSGGSSDAGSPPGPASTSGTGSFVIVSDSSDGQTSPDPQMLHSAIATAPPGSMIITCENRVRTEEVHPIVIEDYPLATRTDLYVRLFEDGLGNPLVVPFVLVRGAEPGPVLGISAAVHGNELNGVKIIHRLLADVDPNGFRGALLCAPVVNIPAYNAGRREFTDGNDLNHVFPGKANGPPAEQYARAFVLTFLPAINYLVDIHTASEGRTNTLYVRADLLSEETQGLALTTNPQIVLHAKGGDGTLRNAARQRNIPAVTMEVGNPSVFQGEMVSEGEHGVFNIMKKIGMLTGDPEMMRIPVICSSSSWLRTTGGGLLETRFQLLDHVKTGQLLAETYDPFGRVLQSYHAPHDGIVIGMSANPLAIPGTRFCHLGVIGTLSQFVRRKKKPETGLLTSGFESEPS